MSYFAMILVFLFLAYIYRNYWGLLWKGKRYGIETDAVVCRIEKNKHVARGAEFYTCDYYVSFQRQDGLQNEARLLNPKRTLSCGSKVRVRYLEERNDCAVLTETKAA